MICKTILAIAAAATIGAATLLPTAASAKGWHHHHHFHHGFGHFGGFGVTIIASDCGWQWVKVGRHLFKKVYVCD